MTDALPRYPELALDRGAQAPDPMQDPAQRWETVCPRSRLTPNRGVAALVDGSQVAIFLLACGELLAIDDHDPFSGAAVLSRGLVGDVAGAPTVASPVYKQRFELRTGRCIEDHSVSIRTWAVRIHDDGIEVAVP